MRSCAIHHKGNKQGNEIESNSTGWKGYFKEAVFEFKQNEEKTPVMQKKRIGRAFQIKRILSAESQNQEKLGSIHETEKGSVWLKPGRETGQDEVGKMDRHQITHGHV